MLTFSDAIAATVLKNFLQGLVLVYLEVSLLLSAPLS